MMVLLTIVLAVGVPSLRGFAAASRSRDAATQLVAIAQYAKARAAAESRVYRLNTDGSAYWLTAQDGQDFIDPGTDMGRRFELPPNTRVELVAGAHGIGTTGGAGDGIEFHPDGRTETAQLRIVDERTGAATLIASPSPAEPFRVVSPEEAAGL